MTVSVNDTVERYVISGAGPYAFSFRIFNDTDLTVVALSTDTPPEVVPLAISADYTVSGANNAAGGSITLTTTAYTAYAGYTVDIRSDTPKDQPTSIRNLARFLPEIHEDAFDYLERQLQDTNRKLERCVRFSDDTLNDGEMSPIQSWLSKYLVIGPTGLLEPAVLTSSGTLTATIIAQLLYPRSAKEISVSAVPIDYTQTYGKLDRFAVNTTPGTTDMQVAWQAAIDSANETYPKVLLTFQNATSKTLLIRSTSVQSLTFEGTTRTDSTIEPTAVDIKQSPQNVNCLIFNQCDNGHAHFHHMRFFSDIAYPGQIIYAVEGGGSDGSGQAMYSAVFEDIWCSLSSQNTGYFRGGFSNLKANNMVYESVKDACWILEGGGNGDLTFINHQLFICFDNFIRGSDANQKTVLTVICLHAYNHLRGRLIEINNGQKLIFDDIIMEPDAANLGNCGLFKFTGCSGIQVTNFSMATNTGVPIGALGIELINSNSGKFVNGTINATVGLSFSGAGVLDLEFINVDFTGCTHCLELTSGTQSGRVRFLRCKFNDAQIRCLVHLGGTPTIDFEFDNCEFLNAGLGGNAASRNIDLTLTGGSMVFRNCRIGQNNVSAVAAYYISNKNAGCIPRFIDCEFVGTPPTGMTDSSTANMPFFKFRNGVGSTVASAATITLPLDGNIIPISGTTGITSITAPGWKGNLITLTIAGNLTVTDGSNLKMAGNFTSGANGGTITYTNVDNTNWLEVSRAVH